MPSCRRKGFPGYENHKAYMKRYVKDRRARDPEFAEACRQAVRKCWRSKHWLPDLERKPIQKPTHPGYTGTLRPGGM